MLERLRASLASAHQGDTPRFTASFGVTDSSRAELAAGADPARGRRALQSKAAGRDRISIADAVTPLADGDSASRGNGRARKPAIVQAAADDDPHPGDF